MKSPNSFPNRSTKALLAAICGTALAALPVFANTDVYLTSTNNSNSWPGSPSAPFYAGNATNFTWILHTNANCTFHYAAGTYETYGWIPGRWQTAQPGCRHAGAGVGQTIIQLVRYPGYCYGDSARILGSDTTRNYDSGLSDNFEVQNMTLDCNGGGFNPADSPTNCVRPLPAAAEAIVTAGTNITLTNLSVIGFASFSGECFPVLLAPLAPLSYAEINRTLFENVVVENCAFSSPGCTNDVDIGCCTVGAGPPCIPVNNIIRNCTASNVHTGTTAFAIGVGDRRGFFAPTVENCVVRDMAIGSYIEIGYANTNNVPNLGGATNADILFRNNVFSNVIFGVYVYMHPGFPIRDITMLGNRFDLSCAFSGASAFHSYGDQPECCASLDWLVFRDNTIRDNGCTAGTIGVGSIVPGNIGIWLGDYPINHAVVQNNRIFLESGSEIVMRTNGVLAVTNRWFSGNTARDGRPLSVIEVTNSPSNAVCCWITNQSGASSWPQGAPIQPMLIQQATATAPSASQPSAVATFPDTITPGDLIVVAVSGSGAVPAGHVVSDSQTNAYSLGSVATNSLELWSAVYYAAGVTGAVTTVTITNALCLAAAEFSGVATSGALDTNASASGTSAQDPLAGPMTPTVTSDLAVGSGAHANGTYTTAGPPFTLCADVGETNAQCIPLAMEYGPLQGSAAVSVGFHLATGSGWSQNGALFKTQPIVFDPSVDFSATNNPSGVWSYGYSTTLGGHFILTTDNGDYTWGGPFWLTNILGDDIPTVFHNNTGSLVTNGTVVVPPYALGLHPGPDGEYSLVRFTAPITGSYQITVAYYGMDHEPTTTDVHVLVNGSSIFDGAVNSFDSYSPPGSGPTANLTVSLSAGATVDFAVGIGSDGGFGWDTTGLSAQITYLVGAPSSYDAAADFSTSQNPSGAWSYGYSTTLGGTFILTTDDGQYNWGGNFWLTNISGYDIPTVFHNSTGSLITNGTVVVPAYAMGLHPGPDGEYSLVRFTAPATGSYQIIVAFYGMDQKPTTTDVHVLVNGSSIFNGAVDSFDSMAPPGSGPTASLTVNLNAGDKVDFAVGIGSDGDFSWDTTGLSVQIVPN